jgi:Flp pilus assembly protein TadD
MSLIIDALKKTQQLRLKEFKGTPFSKCHWPERKSSGISGKQWILIGLGLICLTIFLLILLRPVSPHLATQPKRTIASIERKPSFPKAKVTPPELSRLPTDEGPPPAQTAPPPESWSTRDLPLRGGGKREVVTGQVLPGQERSPEERGEGSLIKQRVEKKNVREAVQPKKSAIKKVGPSAPAVSLKEDLLPKSIGVHEEVGKDRPLSSDVLNQFNLGVYFYNRGEILKAIHTYQKVIEMDPAYVEAYNNLGIIYQEMGDFEKALKSYQKSVDINPRYEKAYNNLGTLFFLKDRYEEALEAFQKALTMNPDNIESLINCGVLFKKKGQWDKAIEFYQKALTKNPLHGETHYNIALLYEQLEKFDLAIGHYQTFIQLSSKTHPDLVPKVKRHLNTLVETRRSKR